MFGTCKNCKMWGRYRPRECDRVGDVQATSDAARMFDIDYGAHDDSGAYGRLVTGPDFGCVHHAPKAARKVKGVE